MREKNNNITLIAGPTGSGKSQLAIELGLREDSVIINADSMQVYDVLRLLTARPDVEALHRLPHYLYGFVSPAAVFSTGLWLNAVRDLLNRSEIQQKHLIFVGGTGLYFRVLTEGLAEIPPIPATIRAHFRQRLEKEGAAELHAELFASDPTTAAQLKPQDGQRLARALEVLAATGRSISDWQRQKSTPLIDMKKAQKILLLPERQSLYRRIDCRFDQMIASGALDEVRTLMTMGLDETMPAMKAIGVRPLSEALTGTMSLEAAIEQAKRDTRHYAKRQMTWFRHQLGVDWQVLAKPD